MAHLLAAAVVMNPCAREQKINKPIDQKASKRAEIGSSWRTFLFSVFFCGRREGVETEPRRRRKGK